MPLRALMGFGLSLALTSRKGSSSLNALAGIDGFWTAILSLHGGEKDWVLMPLRALMGFGREMALATWKAAMQS